MDGEKCKPNTACHPMMDTIDGVYYVVCYHCDKKWKWQIDEQELAEFRKKYGIDVSY